MDTWSHRHTSVCNSVVLFTMLCDWNFDLAHWRLPAHLVSVPVIFGPTVTTEAPLPNASSCEELEIREEMTKKPRYHK